MTCLVYFHIYNAYYIFIARKEIYRECIFDKKDKSHKMNREKKDVTETLSDVTETVKT